MKKIIGLLAITIMLFGKAEAQVKLKLTKLADGETFMVSAIPSQTWSFPQNIVASAQVSIKVPASAHFIAGKITSLIAGAKWTDNAYLESPAGDKNNTYVSFYLQTLGAKNFNFRQGLELPLFTFKNIGTNCFGVLSLVDNASSTTKTVTANGYNIGQHIGILGAEGESFGGLTNAVVECSATATGVKNPQIATSLLDAYPIPASKDLTIEWQLQSAPASGSLKLIITNMLGEEIATIPVNNNTTLQHINVNVAGYAEGLYHFRLAGAESVSPAKPFVVIK